MLATREVEDGEERGDKREELRRRRASRIAIGNFSFSSSRACLFCLARVACALAVPETVQRARPRATANGRVASSFVRSDEKKTGNDASEKRHEAGVA